MTDALLHAALLTELHKYSALTFDAAARLTEPIAISGGTPGADDYYRGQVAVVQRVRRGDDEWIQIFISVDGGKADPGWMGRLFGTITPQTATVPATIRRSSISTCRRSATRSGRRRW